jgi:hypothetical protein
MEWISIEERLPEDNGFYLVVGLAETKGGPIRHMFMPYFSRGQFDIAPAYQATHWMPLPEMPETRTKEKGEQSVGYTMTTRDGIDVFVPVTLLDLVNKVNKLEDEIRDLRDYADLFQDTEVHPLPPSPPRPFYTARLADQSIQVGHVVFGAVIKFPRGGKGGGSKRAAEGLCTRLNTIWTSDKGSTEETE